MCEYCEDGIGQKPFVDLGDVKVYIDTLDPLAEIETHYSVRYAPINHCPMCGRDLRGESE